MMKNSVAPLYSEQQVGQRRQRRAGGISKLYRAAGGSQPADFFIIMLPLPPALLG